MLRKTSILNAFLLHGWLGSTFKTQLRNFFPYKAVSVISNRVAFSLSFSLFLKLILDLGDGEGNGTPLQYSCMEKSHGWRSLVGYSWTQLSDFTFTFHFHALEKEMATHSSVLAWRIPGTGKPGGLPSMGSHRVGHDRSDLAAAADLGEI